MFYNRYLFHEFTHLVFPDKRYGQNATHFVASWYAVIRSLELGWSKYVYWDGSQGFVESINMDQDLDQIEIVLRNKANRVIKDLQYNFLEGAGAYCKTARKIFNMD